MVNPPLFVFNKRRVGCITSLWEGSNCKFGWMAQQRGKELCSNVWCQERHKATQLSLSHVCNRAFVIKFSYLANGECACFLEFPNSFLCNHIRDLNYAILYYEVLFDTIATELTSQQQLPSSSPPLSILRVLWEGEGAGQLINARQIQGISMSSPLPIPMYF